ncbi:alpha/beta fold hydrolase [Cytobacillus solani]|uniref:Hydroxyalkanoic acid synthase n=1 Tax=Cytobacillus solani TaxID=1637975 RepID=A0A0Q3VJ65_9BACI|nr:alpha/beta fold hydrolase [Cytobacillus solani]KOP80052.1 hydroxyalkanoic acid synthase [Bacillus sp. FJAT-21945]KQL21063.1 hydroxyalkanoic acid synthase [Cytobacillus solani]USK54314.1 alpha/beta fold hydrolase [Cytobacillus solani]
MSTPKINRWTGFIKTISALEPEVGLTPRTAIWKKNKATLWYYPSENKKYKVPLFLIYSLINQPFILDLGPKYSLIEAFTSSGYEVYLLDFGIPGYEDKDLTVDDYILRYIKKGVQRALLHSNASEITLMGFCMGGTFAAIYATIADEPIKNLIISVAPIDFSVMPIFSEGVKMLQNGEINLNPILDAWGIIPPAYVKRGMRLATVPISYSPYLSLLSHADDEERNLKWSRFNYWTNSHIPLSAAALKQMAVDFEKENKLINGNLVIGDQPAKLENITANLMAVGASHDRLIPIEQILPIVDHVSSIDKSFHILEGGHGSLAKEGKAPGYLDKWLSDRSN